jgi:hypothetical protein
VRECSGIVDVGLLSFDFDDNGGYGWSPTLATFPELKVRPESL